MTNTPQIAPKRIAIFACAGAQLLDIAGPLAVFSTAGAYDARVVSLRAGPIVTSSGLTLIAEALSDEPVDTLIVAGGPGMRAIADSSDAIAWVRHHAGLARRTASVCTGAFLLAATGLLDGQRVTTHWSQCANLRRHFPALHVEEDPIYLTNGRFWTSAGITAGIDLALALLEEDLGRAAALAVARQMVVFVRRPGGQAQFSVHLALTGSDSRFENLHAWIGANLTRPLPVPVLAARVGMSERTFVRWYRTVTGTTPAKAVERLRIEAARNDLLGHGAGIKDVARRFGYGSEESMRRSFLRVLGVPPGAYRARFMPSGVSIPRDC